MEERITVRMMTLDAMRYHSGRLSFRKALLFSLDFGMFRTKASFLAHLWLFPVFILVQVLEESNNARRTSTTLSR